MRLRWAVSLALTSAVLLWLSVPPISIGWLAWIALVPVALVAARDPSSRAARIGVPLTYAVYMLLLLVPAFPFGLMENQWGNPSVPIIVGDSPVLLIALLIVPLAALLLYAIGFPYLWPLHRTSARAAPVALVLVPAATWTALDLVRVKFDPGGFWGPLFLSQHDTAAASLTTLAGPWLLSFFIVLVNLAIAYALVRRRQAAPVVLAVGGVVAVIVVVAVASLLGEGSSRSLRVAAVQPGYDTAEFDLPVNRYMRRESRNHLLASHDLIEDLGPLTRQAARRGATVVVWPEAVVWVDPHQNESVRSVLTELATDTGATLIVPYFLRSRSHGAAVVVRPDGTLSRPLPKQRPMWFLGENGDNRSLPRAIPTGSGSLGTMLGVDNQDPRSVRALTNRSAELVSSSTHDWQQLAEPQVALSQLHAASLAVPIVRADWRYGSAIIDRHGELVADAGSEKRRTVLVADIEPRPVRTIYSYVGDSLGWIALVVALGAWVIGQAPRARHTPFRPRPSRI